jgi:hypothetical protein
VLGQRLDFVTFDRKRHHSLSSDLIRLPMLLLAALALFQPVCDSQEPFPKWEVAVIGLVGTWERADDVVVGDVSNVQALGSQKISDPPWPVASTINEIFWCRADFHADSVVKGKIPTPGKKLIWAAIRPGCGLERFRYGYEESTPPVTRVWFVREEGEYIRPVVDAGAVFFASFHGRFTAAGKPEDWKRFALLFLNPEALGMSPAHYSVIFYYPVQLVRTILGDTECVEALRALSAYPDVSLHESVCTYLNSNFQQSCK